ncbi:hypothetical protein CIPAW_09G134600 [Carya illinoinensis]|uniref:Protein kinase domain-containing protein n=1 Tax=Carya illinoinensis TaxID=32201 RepID=A0A8T1PKH5_CARIL|nr:hypothetical protein CIPAW_09G134600 [Carya illinoinensis]
MGRVGTSPPDIGNLSFLVSLNIIRKKSFSCSILDNLARLYRLELLHFGFNDFSAIPSEIGNLQNLELLDITSGSFAGSIPLEIFNISTIKVGLNSFSSLIPNPVGNLRFLRLINLASHCSINGNILREIGNLSSLTSLLLDNNQFTGPIPMTMGKLHKLEALYLQNNKPEASNELTGGILECMGNLNSLRNLYLAFNQLTSMVPLTLWNLKYILEVNLSSNLQDGSLSIEMGNMMILRILDLSRNQLSRPFENFSAASFMSTGMNIAIKVLNLQVEEAFKSFDVECEKWLYSHNHYLNILQRLNIMVYIASALEYLHYGYSTTIVHCDLKPSNILLDQDLVAHVADFGMAKLLDYGSKGIISPRGDVYSYNILLMETFTRKRPTDHIFSEQMSLKSWIEESLLVLSVTNIIDSNLLCNERDYASMEELISSIMRLALDCCAESPEQRINIKNASDTLRKIKLQFL